MKIKKLLVLVSMLAVMFSLAGCSENKEKPFEYDETEIVLHTISSFFTYSDIPDEYADYYLTAGNEFEQSAIKGFRQAQTTDKVGAFEDYSDCVTAVSNGTFSIDMVDAEIVNSDDSVSVTIINNAANRDVEITVKFVENAEYYMQYNEILASYASYYGVTEEEIEAQIGSEIEYQLSSSGIYPFVPEEMVVTAVYSKAELMKQAGMNTLIGMGTVFVVLIFISFIISLFKYLPALVAKKPTVEVETKKSAPAPAPVAKAPAATTKDENLVNDAELVAVITAAIYAAAGQTGNGAVSKDKLVVRSIKRVKR